ncbi:hypothetical protein QQY66_33530 [Streptomyces sp. DG2A-72]|uniref:hypothetical protein n=1 Tax=Streptomyces sp. DG2A-72 TaxID=3051386 RepID=UPI00265C7AB3|nr:hypothetical protein [Streptomyces sp. DG2A-72]MDO0936381.1 hypothetical protein [Streptomyces sp. DG2A-72]
MAYTPRRPVADLPFDAQDIMLRYSHSHPAVPFEFEDTLEVWPVEISRYHGEDDCPRCREDGTCEFSETGIPIGDMSFVRIRSYTKDSGWEAADSYTGDIEKVVSVCTEPEYAMTPGLHWSPEFQEMVEGVGDLLIMDRVRLNAEFRGFGIGALVAAEAIRRLSPGCAAVACEPAPAEGEFDDDEPGFAKAQARIAEVWESIGLRTFKDGIYLLDTSLQHPIDCRERWQRYFGR